MRSVIFKSVGMVNFCCFKDPMELVFENNKVVIITGPNGSGKSTMFDAIPYALYGVGSKGLRGDDVVNDEVEKNSHVWLLFRIDEDEYRVDRYCKDSKHGNNVLLTKNGQVIKKGHNEVVPEIERILVPQKLFMNTLLFSQKVKTFFTDLTDSEQKDIFRKVLQLDDFILWYNETNESLKKAEDKLTDLHNKYDTQVKLLEQINESIKKILLEKDKFYVQKEEGIKEEQDKIQSLELAIKTLGEKILNEDSLQNLEEKDRKFVEEILSCKHEIQTISSSLNSIIDGVKNQKKLVLTELQKQSEKEISEAAQERDSSTIKVNEELGNVIKMLREEENSLDKTINNQRNEIKVLQVKKESLENDLSKMGSVNKRNAICPTCKQPINLTIVKELEEHKQETEEEISKINEKILDFEKEIEPLQVHIKRSRKLIKERDEELQAKKKEILLEYSRVHLQSLDKLEKKVLHLLELESKKIEEIKKRNIDQTSEIQKKELELTEEQKKLRERIQRLKDILDKKSKEEKSLEFEKSLLEKLNKAKFDETMLKDFGRTRERTEETILNLKMEGLEIEIEIEILTFLKSAFSSTGIPSMLIDDAVPFMNLQLSSYLEKIGGRYIASVDSQAETKAGEFRDKISVHVLDSKTKANSRKKLSGGQTRVIDICMILTLCDLQSNIQNIKFNILLFDEIFDSLDDENIGYISNLLRSLILDKSVYIISHRQIDSIEADEILKFF